MHAGGGHIPLLLQGQGKLNNGGEQGHSVTLKYELNMLHRGRSGGIPSPKVTCSFHFTLPEIDSSANFIS